MAKKRKAVARAFARAVKNAADETGAKLMAQFGALGADVLAGILSYLGIRVTGRLARIELGQRFPRLAKHLTALTNISSLGGLWYATEKVKFLKEHQTPILVGAGVATIEGLIQAYLPGLAWAVDGNSYQAVGGYRERRPLVAPESVGNFIEVPMAQGALPARSFKPEEMPVKDDIAAMELGDLAPAWTSGFAEVPN